MDFKKKFKLILMLVIVLILLAFSCVSFAVAEDDRLNGDINNVGELTSSDVISIFSSENKTSKHDCGNFHIKTTTGNGWDYKNAY